MIMSPDEAEIVAEQDCIIRKQSKIISKLFLRLLQYEQAEDLDNCGIVQEINEIAKLKS